jgi:hypothetical protein
MQSKEVSLHSILADASSPCLILFLLKNSPKFSPDGQHLGQYQPMLEWAQPAAIVGLIPQLGADVVEGQDLQEVRVKGSEVAGDLVVECRE